MICMKVEKEEFKRVINDASHLEYNYIHLKPTNITNYKINDEEIKYLILNQIHHGILRRSRKSFFGNKIILKNADEEDYQLLKYYVEILSGDLASVK